MRFFIVLLLACVVGVSTFAQPPQESTLSTSLRAHLDDLEVVTARLRGLAFLRPVTVLFPTSEDVRVKLGGIMDEQLTPERVADAMAFYTAFDLLAPDLDLRAVFDAFYAAQVGGFYEPATQEMNVLLLSGGELGDTLPFLERVIAVHEYTHALQDQHFDLATYLGELEDAGNDDWVLARAALVEGDATYIMNLYTQEEVNRDPIGTLLATLSGTLSSTDIPAGTPNILAQELLFPYLQGQEFVMALVREGGLERVNEAFSTPPTSTMHILHPQKYLQGQEPVDVALADISGAHAGWQLAKAGVMGEFYLREYLKTQASLLATSAAAGWAGDGYQVYTHADGGQAWRLAIVWDNPQEADEFVRAWQFFAEQRWGVVVDMSDRTPQCYEQAVASQCFLFGETQTVLTLAPERAFAQALLGE